jgi:RNA polymerase sigma factor (sigma-70 family)
MLSAYTDISILLADLTKKSEAAYAYLYDNYAAALYGVIKKVVNNDDDANDVLQDTFVSIWKNIETYNVQKGGSLFTWMLNIARNKAIDKYRQKSRNSQNQKDLAIVSTFAQAEANNTIRTEAMDVNTLLQHIKPDQKALIDLHYFKGFTHQEISEMANLPLGTIKTKLRSAMQDLKQLISKK